MPTRNRSHLLPRALASVHAQSHTPGPAGRRRREQRRNAGAVAARLARTRGSFLHTGGGSASAARNFALDHAKGRYITYLDDDNVMGPQWLRAVVWAFERNAEAQVGYGVRVMDDPSQDAPWIEFRPWDRQRMQVHCIIDQNVLAHRAGVPEMRYDTDIELGSDWDAAIRATDLRDPVMIPVVATIYGTGIGRSAVRALRRVPALGHGSTFRAAPPPAAGARRRSRIAAADR